VATGAPVVRLDRVVVADGPVAHPDQVGAEDDRKVARPDQALAADGLRRVILDRVALVVDDPPKVIKDITGLRHVMTGPNPAMSVNRIRGHRAIHFSR